MNMLPIAVLGARCGGLRAVATVHGFLDEAKIDYCGRYGDWNHAWADEAFISGEERARKVLARLTS